MALTSDQLQAINEYLSNSFDTTDDMIEELIAFVDAKELARFLEEEACNMKKEDPEYAKVLQRHARLIRGKE